MFFLVSFILNENSMKFSKNLYQQVFQEERKLKTENKEGFLIYLKKGFFTFFWKLKLNTC